MQSAAVEKLQAPGPQRGGQRLRQELNTRPPPSLPQWRTACAKSSVSVITKPKPQDSLDNTTFPSSHVTVLRYLVLCVSY